MKKFSKDTKENLEVLSATFFLPFTFVLGVTSAWWLAVQIFGN